MVNRGRASTHFPLTPRTKGFVERHLQFIEQFGYSALDIADIARDCAYDERQVADEVAKLVQNCLDGHAEQAWQPSAKKQAVKPRPKPRQRPAKPKKPETEPTNVNHKGKPAPQQESAAPPATISNHPHTPTPIKDSKAIDVVEPRKSEAKKPQVPIKQAAHHGRSYADVMKGQRKLLDAAAPNPSLGSNEEVSEEDQPVVNFSTSPIINEALPSINKADQPTTAPQAPRRKWLDAAKGLKELPVQSAPTERPVEGKQVDIKPALASGENKSAERSSPETTAVKPIQPASEGRGVQKTADSTAVGKQYTATKQEQTITQAETTADHVERPPPQQRTSGSVHTILKQSPLKTATAPRHPPPRQNHRQSREPIIHTNSTQTTPATQGEAPAAASSLPSQNAPQAAASYPPQYTTATPVHPHPQYRPEMESNHSVASRPVVTMPGMAPTLHRPQFLQRRQESHQVPFQAGEPEYPPNELMAPMMAPQQFDRYGVEAPGPRSAQPNNMRPPPGMYAPPEFTRMPPIGYPTPVYDPYSYYDPRKASQYVDQFAYIDRRPQHPMMMYQHHDLYAPQDGSNGMMGGYSTTRRMENEQYHSMAQHRAADTVPMNQPEYGRVPPAGLPPIFASATGRTEMSAVSDDTFSMLNPQPYVRQQYGYSNGAPVPPPPPPAPQQQYTNNWRH